ncbi:MAG: hypothetical protein J0I32_09350 [Sphingobacteriales bacterium]|nr:hypothetical protein [Sphingobacteriales bacterium]OJW00203.1 MAG: hypothetical protein BGO52_03710 [Sphingobacteriales bacterium 44-61]
MNFSPYKKKIVDTEEYKAFSNDFDYYINFFQNLSGLISYNGRIISLITNSKIHILDTSLIENAGQTLRSVKLCSSIGCFADANTLIRKLRDDLVLYIYILDVINHRKPFVEDDVANLNTEDKEKLLSALLNIRLNNVLTADEQAIEAWFNNTVTELPYTTRKKLSFENYMKSLKQNVNIKKILDDYNLQDYWETLRTRLNNYVHNNGKQFTNQNFVHAENKNIDTHFKNINTRVSYISSIFVILLLMTESTLISSTDMIDHLDTGIEPPEDCQYFIANFVQEFINTRITKLHPELKQYLKDHNTHGMKID